MLIEEYVYGSEEKARDLTFYREARDWGNLAILAHSIKSSSMTIGAIALSEIAAKVEPLVLHSFFASEPGKRSSPVFGLACLKIFFDFVHFVLYFTIDC